MKNHSRNPRRRQPRPPRKDCGDEQRRRVSLSIPRTLRRRHRTQQQPVKNFSRSAEALPFFPPRPAGARRSLRVSPARRAEKFKVEGTDSQLCVQLTQQFSTRGPLQRRPPGRSRGSAGSAAGNHPSGLLGKEFEGCVLVSLTNLTKTLQATLRGTRRRSVSTGVRLIVQRSGEAADCAEC